MVAAALVGPNLRTQNHISAISLYRKITHQVWQNVRGSALVRLASFFAGVEFRTRTLR